jgi:hypothetical protein
MSRVLRSLEHWPLDHKSFRTLRDGDIAVSPMDAQTFYVESRMASARQAVGKSVNRNSAVMRAFLFVYPLIFLASLVLLVRAFDWWSILVIPLWTVAWFFHGGYAARGNPKPPFPVLLGILSLTVIIVIDGGGPAVRWLACALFAMFWDRLRYEYAVYSFRQLLLYNAKAYELLRHRVWVVVDESMVPAQSRE